MDLTKKYSVVVGAGLTGLAAAWKLASEGHNCLLLEKRSVPGGLAGTEILDNIIFDLGPHFIFPDTRSPGGRLINDLLTEGRVISREFRYGILTDKYQFKMPIKGDILHYPFRYKKEILSNILTGGKSRAPEHSLRHFIESRFGKAYYREVFGPMIKKKTGLEGGALHTDWYIRPERDYKNDRQLLPPTASKMKRILEPVKTFFSTNNYVYPEQGFGAIAERLFARYEKFGGKAIFDSGRIALTCTEDSVVSCQAGELEIPVQDIIWTGSPESLTSLLPGSEQIVPRRVDTIILLLTFDEKQQATNRFAYTYHPDEEIIFNRVYSPKNIFRDNFPDDKDGLCLEINWFKGLEAMTEEEIFHKALCDLECLELCKKNSLHHYRFIRLKKSLPVYGLDYEHKLATFNRDINIFSNLYAVGRTGGTFFCMSQAAINQGLKTATQILIRDSSS